MEKVLAICIFNEDVESLENMAVEFPKVSKVSDSFEECVQIALQSLTNHFKECATDLSVPMPSWKIDQAKLWMETKTTLNDQEIELLSKQHLDGKALSQMTLDTLLDTGLEKIPSLFLLKTIKKWNNKLNKSTQTSD